MLMKGKHDGNEKWPQSAWALGRDPSDEKPCSLQLSLARLSSLLALYMTSPANKRGEASYILKQMAVSDLGSKRDEEKQPLIDAISGSKEEVAAGDNWAKGLAGLSSTTTIILYYALCSSTMLVINKASRSLPMHAPLLFHQKASHSSHHTLTHR